MAYGETPTIRDSSGNVVYTGVISNLTAVFTFDSISGGAIFNRVTGGGGQGRAIPSLSLALLSYHDVNLSSIDVSATDNNHPGPGYYNAAVGAPGGAGGIEGRSQDGYTGAGNLKHFLGGGGGGFSVNNPDGAGGGGIEIGALGNITLANVTARGSDGVLGSLGAAGGGGGGGGVLIHGNSVTLNGTIDVSGGAGGAGFEGGAGGGGGGGEIDIVYGQGGFINNGSFVVAAGPGGVADRGLPGFAGSDGTVNLAAVPEPSSLVLAVAGGLGDARPRPAPATRRRRKDFDTKELASSGRGGAGSSDGTPTASGLPLPAGRPNRTDGPRSSRREKF